MDEPTDLNISGLDIPDAPAAPGALGVEYGAPALEQIQAAARGNGVKPELIRIKKITGEVAEFTATVSLILRTRTMERVLGGKKTGGEKVEGPQGVRDGLEKERLRILSSADILDQIRQLVVERKDKGFGTRNEIIKLPFLTKEYVHHQPCKTCQAQGQIKCQRCSGRGAETCPRCNGQSMEICTQCRGAQLIYNGNDKVPCQRCNGQGRTPCAMCNQSRRIPCTACRAKGSTPCQNCNGQAWHSYITTAEVDVVGTFSFNPDEVPLKLRQTMETRAKEIPQYAEIAMLATRTQAQIEGQQKSDEIPLQYHVRLPYAEAEFGLGPQGSVNAFLLGQQASIADIPAFLETLLKTGMRVLQEAAKGRGNVAEKIQRAGQYKTIRQSITASAKYSKGKALKLLIKNTPLGLSEAAGRTLINNADAALKNVTAKPRRNGVFAGVLLAGILFAVHMAAGLRGIMVSYVPDEMMQIAADGAVLALGMLASILIIQLFGAKAIQQALGKLLPPDQKNSILAKPGHSGLWSALLCVIVFIAATELSVHVGNAPAWYMTLRGLIAG